MKRLLIFDDQGNLLPSQIKADNKIETEINWSLNQDDINLLTLHVLEEQAAQNENQAYCLQRDEVRNNHTLAVFPPPERLIGYNINGIGVLEGVRLNNGYEKVILGPDLARNCPVGTRIRIVGLVENIADINRQFIARAPNTAAIWEVVGLYRGNQGIIINTHIPAETTIRSWGLPVLNNVTSDYLYLAPNLESNTQLQSDTFVCQAPDFNNQIVTTVLGLDFSQAYVMVVGTLEFTTVDYVPQTGNINNRLIAQQARLRIVGQPQAGDILTLNIDDQTWQYKVPADFNFFCPPELEDICLTEKQPFNSDFRVGYDNPDLVTSGLNYYQNFNFQNRFLEPEVLDIEDRFLWRYIEQLTVQARDFLGIEIDLTELIARATRDSLKIGIAPHRPELKVYIAPDNFEVMLTQITNANFNVEWCYPLALTIRQEGLAFDLRNNERLPVFWSCNNYDIKYQPEQDIRNTPIVLANGNYFRSSWLAYINPKSSKVIDFDLVTGDINSFWDNLNQIVQPLNWQLGLNNQDLWASFQPHCQIKSDLSDFYEIGYEHGLNANYSFQYLNSSRLADFLGVELNPDLESAWCSNEIQTRYLQANILAIGGNNLLQVIYKSKNLNTGINYEFEIGDIKDYNIFYELPYLKTSLISSPDWQIKNLTEFQLNFLNSLSLPKLNTFSLDLGINKEVDFTFEYQISALNWRRQRFDFLSTLVDIIEDWELKPTVTSSYRWVDISPIQPKISNFLIDHNNYIQLNWYANSSFVLQNLELGIKTNSEIDYNFLFPQSGFIDLEAIQLHVGFNSYEQVYWLDFIPVGGLILGELKINLDYKWSIEFEELRYVNQAPINRLELIIQNTIFNNYFQWLALNPVSIPNLELEALVRPKGQDYYYGIQPPSLLKTKNLILQKQDKLYSSFYRAVDVNKQTNNTIDFNWNDSFNLAASFLPAINYTYLPLKNINLHPPLNTEIDWLSPVSVFNIINPDLKLDLAREGLELQFYNRLQLQTLVWNWSLSYSDALAVNWDSVIKNYNILSVTDKIEINTQELVRVTWLNSLIADVPEYNFNFNSREEILLNWVNLLFTSPTVSKELQVKTSELLSAGWFYTGLADLSFFSDWSLLPVSYLQVYYEELYSASLNIISLALTDSQSQLDIKWLSDLSYYNSALSYQLAIMEINQFQSQWSSLNLPEQARIQLEIQPDINLLTSYINTRGNKLAFNPAVNWDLSKKEHNFYRWLLPSSIKNVTSDIIWSQPFNYSYSWLRPINTVGLLSSSNLNINSNSGWSLQWLADINSFTNNENIENWGWDFNNRSSFYYQLNHFMVKAEGMTNELSSQSFNINSSFNFINWGDKFNINPTTNSDYNWAVNRETFITWLKKLKIDTIHQNKELLIQAELNFNWYINETITTTQTVNLLQGINVDELVINWLAYLDPVFTAVERQLDYQIQKQVSWLDNLVVKPEFILNSGYNIQSIWFTNFEPELKLSSKIDSPSSLFFSSLLSSGYINFIRLSTDIDLDWDLDIRNQKIEWLSHNLTTQQQIINYDLLLDSDFTTIWSILPWAQPLVFRELDLILDFQFNTYFNSNLNTYPETILAEAGLVLNNRNKFNWSNRKNTLILDSKSRAWEVYNTHFVAQWLNFDNFNYLDLEPGYHLYFNTSYLFEWREQLSLIESFNSDYSEFSVEQFKLYWNSYIATSSQLETINIDVWDRGFNMSWSRLTMLPAYNDFNLEVQNKIQSYFYNLASIKPATKTKTLSFNVYSSLKANYQFNFNFKTLTNRSNILGSLNTVGINSSGLYWNQKIFAFWFNQLTVGLEATPVMLELYGQLQSYWSPELVTAIIANKNKIAINRDISFYWLQLSELIIANSNINFEIENNWGLWVENNFNPNLKIEINLNNFPKVKNNLYQNVLWSEENISLSFFRYTFKYRTKITPPEFNWLGRDLNLMLNPVTSDFSFTFKPIQAIIWGDLELKHNYRQELLLNQSLNAHFHHNMMLSEQDWDMLIRENIIKNQQSFNLALDSSFEIVINPTQKPISDIQTVLGHWQNRNLVLMDNGYLAWYDEHTGADTLSWTDLNIEQHIKWTIQKAVLQQDILWLELADGAWVIISPDNYWYYPISKRPLANLSQVVAYFNSSWWVVTDNQILLTWSLASEQWQVVTELGAVLNLALTNDRLWVWNRKSEIWSLAIDEKSWQLELVDIISWSINREHLYWLALNKNSELIDSLGEIRVKPENWSFTWDIVFNLDQLGDDILSLAGVELNTEVIIEGAGYWPRLELIWYFGSNIWWVYNLQAELVLKLNYTSLSWDENNNLYLVVVNNLENEAITEDWPVTITVSEQPLAWSVSGGKKYLYHLKGQSSGTPTIKIITLNNI